MDEEKKSKRSIEEHKKKMFSGGINLQKYVEEAIHKAIMDKRDLLIEQAKAEFEKQLWEETARMAIQISKFCDISSMGTNLTITIKDFRDIKKGDIQ